MFGDLCGVDLKELIKSIVWCLKFWRPLEITDLLCISTCIVSIWIDGDPSNFYSFFSLAEF